MGGFTLGPSVARNRTPAVASLIAPIPGSTAPAPKTSTVVSLEPQTTGMPATSPVAFAATSLTVPTTSVGRTIGGSFSIGQPTRSQSAGDQDLVRSSAMSAPTASL